MKKTDHSVFIFLPSAGSDLYARNTNKYGNYWTSSYVSDRYVYKFDWNYYDADSVHPPRYDRKYFGYSIRAVCSPNS